MECNTPQIDLRKPGKELGALKPCEEYCSFASPPFLSPDLIPKIFENKALAAMKSNTLNKKLSFVQSEINKQLEGLADQKWTLNIPYGSYFSGLKWSGKYKEQVTQAAPC